MVTEEYSSMIAASILKSRAIHNFINITDGFDAVKESEVKVSEFVRPSSLQLRAVGTAFIFKATRSLVFNSKEPTKLIML